MMKQWAVTLALALGGLIASGVVGYFHNDRALGERIRAVEVQQNSTDGRLDRIEHKIDQLLERGR